MSETNDFDALKAKLLRWSVVGPKELEITLRRSAEMVRREAQEHHLSGPPMPRGVGDPNVATLAAPTGTLRKNVNIRTHVEPGIITAEVGVPGGDTGYGRIHELGLGRMPERPFLRPSLATKHSEIFHMTDEAWFKAYGK